MSVVVRNLQQRIRLSPHSVETAIRHIQQACGYPSTAVGALITDNAYIADMNREYRNIDKPTDILSFGANEFSSPENFVDPLYSDEGIIDLGDMIISAEYVADYAKQHGLDMQKHWLRILTHGFVHLLGYDHENDADFQIMNAKEMTILQELYKHNLDPVMLWLHTREFSSDNTSTLGAASTPLCYSYIIFRVYIRVYEFYELHCSPVLPLVELPNN